MMIIFKEWVEVLKYLEVHLGKHSFIVQALEEDLKGNSNKEEKK